MSGAPLGIVGAGAWGTALANAAAAAGCDVVLWTRDPDHAREMSETRENARHLPGVALADAVRPTCALTDLAASDAALLVVPAQAVREVAVALPLVLALYARSRLALAPAVASTCARGSPHRRRCRDLQRDRPVAVLSGRLRPRRSRVGLPTG